MRTSWDYQTRSTSPEKGEIVLFLIYREILGDIYLISDLMETDLNRVIKSKQKLKTEHIQYFLY